MVENKSLKTVFLFISATLDIEYVALCVLTPSKRGL